jgi:Zn-dependent peptidase ImmA (M78 family)
LKQQQSWADDYEAFRSWRQAIEGLGVLTFQASRVEVEEMRGVSIFYDLFSVVLLNAADAVRGRIFTLAHELAHLLLRTAATKDSSATLADPDVAHEVWCNEFAGCLLVPAGSVSWTSKETDPKLGVWVGKSFARQKGLAKEGYHEPATDPAAHPADFYPPIAVSVSNSVR